MLTLLVRLIIPGLPFYYGFEVLKRYLEAQSIVLPTTIVSLLTVPITALLLFVTIKIFDMGCG